MTFPIQEAELFFDKLIEKLEGFEIPSHWSIDHLCYRVKSNESYEIKKELFSKCGQLLIESEVNGRMISTFKLNNPLSFLGRKIELLELPAPKKGKVTPEGFEHIEIVSDVTFQEIMNMFPHGKFDQKGLSKVFNAELELELGDLAVKFHQLSLESVINVEGNTKVFNALKDSQILEKFINYSPLIAGTFPLNIHLEDSDLDILMMDENFEQLVEKLKSVYGNEKDFKSEILIDHAIVNWNFEDVPFEVYISKQLPIKQKAYRHFQIEEKILKMADENFKNKIIELKKSGLKTEPAFTKLLNLDGDPYDSLLSFGQKSETEIGNYLKTL